MPVWESLSAFFICNLSHGQTVSIIMFSGGQYVPIFINKLQPFRHVLVLMMNKPYFCGNYEK